MCKLRTINNYFRIGTFMDNDDPFVELPADRADVRDWIERVKKAYVVIRGNIERAQEAMPSRPMGSRNRIRCRGFGIGRDGSSALVDSNG